MISCNSSYVDIMITPFRWVSEWVRARPPATRVSILYCQGNELIGISEQFNYLSFRMILFVLIKD